MQYQIDMRGDRNRKWLFIGLAGALGVILIATVLWWSYSSYRISRDEQAQLALAAQIERFKRTMADTTTSAASWDALAQELSAAATMYHASSLAAFFHIYAAEAFARSSNEDNRISRVCQALDKALALLDKQSVYYYLYATKRAALALNEAQDPEHHNGRRMLLNLAQDPHNICNALGWYYLWEYGIAHNDQELIALATPKLRSQSALASLLPTT